MHRKKNPAAVAAVIICIIAAFLIAAFVKGKVPEAYYNWSGIVFWLVFIVTAGVGTFFSGRFLNRRR